MLLGNPPDHTRLRRLVRGAFTARHRDPERFTAPDRSDLGRPDNAPLSFGGGIPRGRAIGQAAG